MTNLTTNQVTTIRTILALSKPGSGVYIENDEFGVWFDDLATDSIEYGMKDKKQARVTINQMIKKGLFKVDTTVEEGSSWLTLTDTGKEAITEVLMSQKALASELAEEADEDLVGTQDVDPGTPEDEVADAIAEIEELLKPHYVPVADRVFVPEQTEEAFTEEGSITRAGTVSKTDTYTAKEWTDADGTEWIETIFTDGSQTLKRRKNVSGAWRTDYWGTEAGTGKKLPTTAKAAKMARAYGGFSTVL